MRITETQLRKTIREIIKESYLSQFDPSYVAPEQPKPVDPALEKIAMSLGIKVSRARGGEAEVGSYGEKMYTVEPRFGSPEYSLFAEEAVEYIITKIGRKDLEGFSPEEVAEYLIQSAR